jgi:hypothetical protein
MIRCKRQLHLGLVVEIRKVSFIWPVPYGSALVISPSVLNLEMTLYTYGILLCCLPLELLGVLNLLLC